MTDPMTECFVGIDTSNYTTSAAVCSVDGEFVANLKIPLPVADGACGLRQSDAVFAHTKNLPELTDRLRDVLRGRRVLAVGCSTRPRSVADSYMPCFLAGRAAAGAFASCGDLPIFEFSHQEGHIMAALASSGCAEKWIQAPFGAFHVSGGTTEVLYVEPCGAGFTETLIGQTEDLHAGQAVDRVGVMMGLRFPCGPEMEKLANAYAGEIPPAKICVRDGNCSLSGLQNLSATLWEKTRSREEVSAFVFSFLAKTLCRMTEQVREKYPRLPILYAGGVMSNRILQAELGKLPDTAFAQPAYSSDNAMGIALLCRAAYFTRKN